MKILSRDFTTKEKVLLVILCLILLALAYYRFVYVPSVDAVAAANADRDMYQIELIGALTKEKQLRQMQEELDELGELQTASRMESYNNSKAELTLLNSALETASSYSVSFAGVTRDGDQIRRNFSLSFTTKDFASAKKIVDRLAESEYRCLIGDMHYNKSYVRAQLEEGEIPAAPGRWFDEVYYYDVISVDTTATFFETMVGGTPDEGLPADKKA